MSNTLYNKARELGLTTGLGWGTNTIKAQLIDVTNYTMDVADVYLDEVPLNSRVGNPVTLSGKSTTDGGAGASNTTFTGIADGSPTIEALILYIDTGDEATSHLIAYIDTMTDLPITPNGNNIVVTWNSDVNKIFRL